jgi:hypothetical protein
MEQHSNAPALYQEGRDCQRGCDIGISKAGELAALYGKERYMSADTLTFIGFLLALVGVAIGVLISLLPTELTRKRDDYQNIANIWSIAQYDLLKIRKFCLDESKNIEERLKAGLMEKADRPEEAMLQTGYGVNVISRIEQYYKDIQSLHTKIAADIQNIETKMSREIELYEGKARGRQRILTALHISGWIAFIALVLICLWFLHII